MEKSIEIVRKRLEQSINKNGITDIETIKWSKLFDKLIIINTKLQKHPKHA